jgi:ADP-heptose:LPS heptosyltransferase
MHIAVSQGTPTFTIWGASDYNLYGYQNINKENNKIAYKEISCHPCNSWIAPNTSRVMDPQECPDFACIRSLKPEEVFSQLTPFANRILNSK